MVIWKYELAIQDSQSVEMPSGARILSVGNQRGALCMWAAVDPSAETASRTIRIVGTGHEFTERLGDMAVIGTVVADPFVWHVFEDLR